MILHKSPLYQRIITALILIPPVVMGIWMLPTGVLALFFGTIILLGAWEWAGLIGISRYAYVALIGTILIIAWSWLPSMNKLIDVLILTVAMWGGGLLIVGYYPALPSWWQARSVQAVTGLLVLIPAWIALIALHGGWIPEVRDGPGYTIFLCILVWVADSAAFFAGRRWGSHRLAPRVSPAKTIEGLLGAGVATMVIAVVGAWWLGIQQGMQFVGICLVTLLFSVVGDLLESVVKRTQGAKDSGMLLPGHGGVLDRIDSLTAAAPVFVLGLHYCGG